MNWRRSIGVTDPTANPSNTNTSSETQARECTALVLSNDVGSYVDDSSSTTLKPVVTNR